MIDFDRITIEEINDIDRLKRYQPLWRAMLAQTAQATFFQSLEWLLLYWKYFGKGQRLRVLLAWDQDRPLGIVPLVIRSESTRVGTVRVLTYPLNDWGTFFGPLGPDPAVVLQAAMRHVQATPRDWDMIDLRWIDDDTQSETCESMASTGLKPHRQAWDRTALLDMNGSWDDYWQSRTKKWRESVRYYLRRINREGHVEFIRYRPEAGENNDPRWDLYDACLSVAKASWQGRSTTGSTLSHDSVAAFLHEVHEAAVRTGSLDLCLLQVDGRPIAFVYNYRHGGRVFGLRMGFDPSAANLGPGKVLQYYMFKDSFDRGDVVYDMGFGSLKIKTPWLTSIATSHRLTCFGSTSLRTGLLRLKRWYVDRRYGDEYLAGGKTIKQPA